MAPITNPEKAAESVKSAIGDSVTSLNPEQLLSAATLLRSQAGVYRAASETSKSMASTVRTKAATFTSEHAPASEYQDTITALSTACDTFHNALSDVADRMETDALGMEWFATHQSGNDNEGGRGFREAADQPPLVTI